jgi:hypothetical protein
LDEIASAAMELEVRAGEDTQQESVERDLRVRAETEAEAEGPGSVGPGRNPTSPITHSE